MSKRDDTVDKSEFHDENRVARQRVVTSSVSPQAAASLEGGGITPTWKRAARRGCEDDSKGTEAPASLPSHQFGANAKCGMTHVHNEAKQETKSPPEKNSRHAKKIASTEPDQSLHSEDKKVAHTRWTPVHATACNDSTWNMDPADDSYAHPDQKMSDVDKKHKEDYDIEKGKDPSMDDEMDDERMDAQTGEEQEHNEAASVSRDVSRRRPAAQIPGAVRIVGLDASPLNDLAETEEEATQAGSTTVPELMAELVNREEEERMFRERMIEDAPFAEVQSTWCSKRMKQWLAMGAIAFVVLAIAVGVSLGVTLPREEPMQPLVELLSAVSFDGGEALRTPSTPQNMAYEWLANDTNLDTYMVQQRIQRYALAAFYFSTNGTGWEERQIHYGHECDFSFIKCATDGEVLELVLVSNNLRGRLPPEIALLSNSLAMLHIGQNQISGSILSEIGLLTAMRSANLDRNNLSGTVPSEIGLLTTMELLDLDHNQLLGFIPSEIGLLTAMARLDLDHNQLLGSIPSEIGFLTAILDLDLDLNQLSGSIPSELGHLTAMTQLDFDLNQLSGSIPSEIGLLTSMVELDLSGNQLTGTIPSSIHNMTNLSTLWLYDNNFTGNFTCPGFTESCWISCNPDDFESDIGADPLYQNGTCRSL